MIYKKGEFTISGFIIGLIVIAMLATSFGLLMSAMADEYGVEGGNDTFAKYSNYTEELTATTEEIRDATDIEQQDGILDVIGGYFSAGYAALKTTTTSFDMFDTMLNDASGDIEFFALYRVYLYMIFAIAIFIGIVVTVLIKMRI